MFVVLQATVHIYVTCLVYSNKKVLELNSQILVEERINTFTEELQHESTNAVRVALMLWTSPRGGSDLLDSHDAAGGFHFPSD